jgi:hypothetical protein
MKTCVPCGRSWMTWTQFVRHMANTHHVNRDQLWRRANQIGDLPACAVRSIGGRWALMVQSSLGL